MEFPHRTAPAGSALRGDRAHEDARTMPREARSTAPGEAISADVRHRLRASCNKIAGRNAGCVVPFPRIIYEAPFLP